MNAGKPSPQSCQGDPCNAGTGNNYQAATDYTGTGTYPVNLIRTYNSGGTAPTSINVSIWGSQWRATYDRSIAYMSNTSLRTASLLRADGTTSFFSQAVGTATPPLTTTTWTPNSNVIGILVEIGVDAAGNPTGWTYLNENDETETYNAAGQLTALTNRAGQTQTLTYSDGTTGVNGGLILTAAGLPTTVVLPPGRLIRIADPANRTLQLGYDAAGRVVTLTDPAGSTTRYSYSGAQLTDNLTSITYPDGNTRTYLYGEAANVSATPNSGVSYTHALTGLVDENGQRFASWTYDATGRATLSELGAFGSGINHIGLAYSTPDVNGNSTTTVTDPRGNARIYNFSTLLNVVQNTGITGPPCNGCSATFSYDINGNVASRTDFNGNTVCYTYDLTRNLETTRVEGLGLGVACPANLASYVPPTTTDSVIRKITTQWHTSLRLPVVIAEPLRITTNHYDPLGNLLTQSTQPTADTNGGAGLTATPQGTARTTTSTYNTAGQLLTLDGPRTDVADITTYTYYANDDPSLGKRGNLSSITDALGHTTRITAYDANGKPLTLVDPNGLVTTLSYSPRGRLTSRNSGGELTTYNYDGAGNLTGVTLPTAATYTYRYDAAHRLTGITDNAGEHINYTLDVMGNRTLEQRLDNTDNLSQTHSRRFDALNRLNQDIGALNQTTTYTYDAVGNLTGINDPLNRSTANTYDALNRLITTTNPNNGLTQYGYDALDQLTGLTDPNNLTTQYRRDGLGNLNQTQSPDTGTTQASYDTAGNLTTRSDAKGQITSYTYDALNRVTAISYTGGQTITYQYDQGDNGTGHLTQLSDATGTTTYRYDLHGRLTNTTQQIANTPYSTAYAYDAQGRLNSLTYPSGRTVDYTFDPLGRINQIATTFNGTTQIVASAIIYQPFGAVQSFTYGDGQTQPIQTYTRQTDQDGRIASYTLNGKPLSIGYDAASQITSVTDPQNPANTASYHYDPTSWLTAFNLGATNQNYSYDLNGNRTSQTIGATTTAYGYAPGSNRLTSLQTGTSAPQTITQDANGATTADPTRQYAYDQRGRLIQTTTAQGTITYTLDAQGLRIRKQAPYAHTDTLYHYDAQGHLIAEHENGSTRYTRETLYLGDQPVAVLQ